MVNTKSGKSSKSIKNKIKNTSQFQAPRK